MFKKVLITIAATFIFITNANAADFSVKSVATVDLRKVMAESKAVKAADKEVAELRNKYIKETEAKTKELKQKEEQLKKQQKAMSEEAFAKKVQEFRMNVAKEEGEVNKKTKILNVAYVKSLELIRNETIKIVADIAKEKNLDIVMVKGEVLFAKDEYDISGEVIEKLNKKLAKVNISVDQKK